MKDIGDMNSSCSPVRLLIVAAVFLAASASCKKDDGPPLNGHCGLSGQKVWCNRNPDCVELGLGDYCNVYGNCLDGGWLEYECHGRVMGSLCFIPPGSFCNASGLCTFPCHTHDDCPDGLCRCKEGVSLCSRFRCLPEGTCPSGTSAKEGTLICSVDQDILEGDCHGYSDGTCDASYVPVGERGCIRIQ